MRSYDFCGQLLQSDILLPELLPSHGPAAEWTFRYLETQPPPKYYGAGYHRWRSANGEVWLQFTKIGDSYLLTFPGLADFVVNDTAEIICYPAENIPRRTIRHLLLNQVLPLALDKKGQMVLHSSAIETPQGIIAFLGIAGRGKSTLAASFAAQGFLLVTDDFLVMQEQDTQWLGTPSYPGIRLWGDVMSTIFNGRSSAARVAHYSNKLRLSLGAHGLGFCQRVRPIRRLYLLTPVEPNREESQQVTIARITAREAFMALFMHSFHLDLSDPQRLRDNFQNLSRLAERPLFYSLSYPRELSLLPRVQAAILEHLQQP